jgi:hypothetical protein
MFLTPKRLCDGAGVERPADATDFEVIFTACTAMPSSAFEGCVALRSIEAISTGLRVMPCFVDAACASTLTRLCLTDQGLRKIEPLQLPNLRELLLHRNRIARIENLEGCPQLQRLWLSDNRIAKMENLHCVGNLRELWLQRNQIARISGVGYLPHLASIGLSGNPIADFRDLRRLAVLPLLSELRLAESTFGPCPIARAEGYRNFVLCQLPQVRVLDGIDIDPDHRRGAEALALQLATDFYERVQSVERENSERMQAIDARWAGSESRAHELRSNLVKQLNRLETIVVGGRVEIESEIARQAQLRAANGEMLEAQLRKLVARHASETQRLVQREEECMAREALDFARARRRISAQLELSAWLDEVMLGTLDVPLAGPREGWRREAASEAAGGSGETHGSASPMSPRSGAALLPRRRARTEPLLTVVPLPEESEIGRFVLQLVRGGDGDGGEGDAGAAGKHEHHVGVVSMYHLHNSAAERRFHAACAAEQEEPNAARSGGSGGARSKERPLSAGASMRAERVFFSAAPHVLESTLMVGHGAGSAEDEAPLHAFHSLLSNAVLMGDEGVSVASIRAASRSKPPPPPPEVAGEEGAPSEAPPLAQEPAAAAATPGGEGRGESDATRRVRHVPILICRIAIGSKHLTVGSSPALDDDEEDAAEEGGSAATPLAAAAQKRRALRRQLAQLQRTAAEILPSECPTGQLPYPKDGAGRSASGAAFFVRQSSAVRFSRARHRRTRRACVRCAGTARPSLSALGRSRTQPHAHLSLPPPPAHRTALSPSPSRSFCFCARWKMSSLGRRSRLRRRRRCRRRRRRGEAEERSPRRSKRRCAPPPSRRSCRTRQSPC